MVPEVELRDGGGKVAGVNVFEKRGAEEAAGAQVEGEIDEGVELGLRERNSNGIIHASGSGGYVTLKESDGLVLRNGLAGIHACGMAIADGPHAALVLIRGEDVSLEQLGKSEAVFTVGEVIHAHSDDAPAVASITWMAGKNDIFAESVSGS